jgi:hypothetical protein
MRISKIHSSLVINSLDALRVVIVLLGASSSARASSSTSVSVTAALSKLLRSNRTGTGSSRCLSRLSDSRQGRRLCSGLSNRGRRRCRCSRGSSRLSSRLSSGAGSSRPHGRSDARVGGSAAVDVEHHASLVLLVCAGERDASGESGGTGSADLDVHALHVELGALGSGALVQGEDLGAEDVLAGSKASGDLCRVNLCSSHESRGVDMAYLHLMLSLDASVRSGKKPVNRVLSTGNRLVLPDLRPAPRGASLAGIHHDRALVRRRNDVVARTVGVVVPLEGQLIAGVGADGLGSFGARDIALDVLGGHVEHGVVVGGRVDVAAGFVADALVFAVDEDVPDGGVGGSCAGEGEGEDGGLHFE